MAALLVGSTQSVNGPSFETTEADNGGLADLWNLPYDQILEMGLGYCLGGIQEWW